MTPSQRYLSITNPVERANDLLKLHRQQIMVHHDAWAECVQQLLVHMAFHTEHKRAALEVIK